MFSVVIWARRREDMTPEAFRPYWIEQHAPLVARSYEGLRRYVVSPVVSVPRGETALFDGIAEMVFETREAFVAAVRSEAGQAAAADFKTFTAASGVLFVEQHVAVG